MQQVLLITLGRSLGCVTRYGMSLFVYDVTSEGFPWGTMVVNITGSFLIGVFAQLFDTALIPSQLRSGATIGFVGGYTTFSTYTFETLNLIREGELRLVPPSNRSSFLALWKREKKGLINPEVVKEHRASDVRTMNT